MIAETVVEIEGCNGQWATIAGPQEGDRGMHLATDIQGFFDPPVKVVYEEPGNYPGARYLNHRILRRDMTFGVWILNDAEHGENSWQSRDSEWRKMWDYDKDTYIHITTEDSGRRTLKCRLGEAMEVDLVTDPHGRSMNMVKMTVIAGDPFWYGEDATWEAECQKDTTFNPILMDLPFPWPLAELPKETLYIEIANGDTQHGLNPTDQTVFPKWAVPGSELPPSEPYIPFLPWLGAPTSPATIWTIPDYSFDDPEFANRRLRLPSLIGGLRTASVQVVNIVGKPTSGTWKLTYNGQSTVNLSRTASAATVQAALEALPAIGEGNVVVDGGPAFLVGTRPYTVAFTGSLAGTPVKLMTGSSSFSPTTAYVQVYESNTGYTAGAEDCLIDTDPRVEQVTALNGSPVWQRMNGVRFRNSIPPWTKTATFEITVSGAKPGQMVQLRVPRPWSRPWGLE
ncbi:Uncharacterised protein [Mycobacteroides abscessus subsp. abscessus]|uniref:phage tail protein n=1 Tax=Mycobacteroides abscessus TaxID=36809 RepID=UPI000927E826|nr:phage tail protein [Mycobacteroides abscessus]QPO17400.1 minor tail protein [Mycobacterium phage phiGD24-3]QSM02254.1 minor tail protein [Mycobacterium phage prophiGD24-3]WJJ55781.1 minor tail protein [Mycobacterium phage prophiT46-3]MBN7403198.1 phage tail protein [Mycobacteroides abscessus subsp. abscessus]MDB2220410.1 phage tail protein [Mycobacteroides abscessus subsp. abscessus]